MLLRARIAHMTGEPVAPGPCSKMELNSKKFCMTIHSSIYLQSI